MNQSAVTAQEMKEIERRAAEKGIPYIDMMENAGRIAAEEIMKSYDVSNKIIAVVTGKGNNGGDGYVAARYLHKAGASVMVIMADGLPATDDAKTNFDLCVKDGIEILHYESQSGDLLLSGADLIADAVFGAGFHGEFRENILPAIRGINSSDAKVVAFDLPSGLNADTGESAADSVKAELTIAFARLKKAHLTPNGMNLCGRIKLVDIGI